MTAPLRTGVEVHSLRLPDRSRILPAVVQSVSLSGHTDEYWRPAFLAGTASGPWAGSRLVVKNGGSNPSVQVQTGERSLVVAPMFHASAVPSAFSCIARGGALFWFELDEVSSAEGARHDTALRSA